MNLGTGYSAGGGLAVTRSGRIVEAPHPILHFRGPTCPECGFDDVMTLRGGLREHPGDLIAGYYCCTCTYQWEPLRDERGRLIEANPFEGLRELLGAKE